MIKDGYNLVPYIQQHEHVEVVPNNIGLMNILDKCFIVLMVVAIIGLFSLPFKNISSCLKHSNISITNNIVSKE